MFVIERQDKATTATEFLLQDGSWVPSDKGGKYEHYRYWSDGMRKLLCLTRDHGCYDYRLHELSLVVPM